MAVAGTGLYVFVLYVVIARRRTRAHAVRSRAARPGPATSARDCAVDIAKVVTELGSFASVTALLVVAVVVLLAPRGAPVDAALLVLGFALVYLAVDVTKAAIDRPRPAGPLVNTERVVVPERPRRLLDCLDRRGRGAHQGARPPEPGGDRHRGDRADRRRSACPGSTCAPTTGRTWPAAGASGVGSSGLLATIALVVEHVRHNEPRACRRPPAHDARPHHHGAHDRARRGPDRLVLRRPDRPARVALLRPPLGEARRELPHALHPRARCSEPAPSSASRSSGATTATPRSRTLRRLGERPSRRPAALRFFDVGLARTGGAAGELAAAPRSFLDALDEVSEAVEAGAGLPSVARAAGTGAGGQRDRARLPRAACWRWPAPRPRTSAR